MKHVHIIQGRAGLLLAFFLLFTTATAAWSEKQKLPADTVLPIQGIAQRGIKVFFAGGSTVLLNDQKEVRKGTLAKETVLTVPGDRKVAFCRNSVVEFSLTGHVQKGIMTADQELKLEGSPKLLRFRGNLPICFGSTGVNAGTTAEAALFGNPRNKGIEEKYPAGTYVMFTITGQVYMIQPPGR